MSEKRLGWTTVSEPFDEYQRLEYMSFAKLKCLLESPKTFEWHYIKNKPKKVTPAMELGALIDWALLNPKEFRRRAKVAPDVKRNTKEGKAEYERWTASLMPDAMMVEPKHQEKILEMIQSVREHPEASALLWPKGGEYNMLGYFQEPKTKMVCQLRPDILLRKEGLIVELKTTNDARPHAFSRTIGEQKWGVQTALYTVGAEALEAKKFESIWVVVESTEPYHVEIYPPKEQLVAAGKQDVGTGIELFKDCQKSGRWYGYNKTIKEIDMPIYEYYKREEE